MNRAQRGEVRTVWIARVWPERDGGRFFHKDYETPWY